MGRSDAPDDRAQVDVPVGDVDRQDPVPFEVPEVEAEGLAGEEVDQNRVPGESIEHQKIVAASSTPPTGSELDGFRARISHHPSTAG